MSHQLSSYGSRPVARRTLLSLGETTAWRIVLSLNVIGSLSACYRAPGTARDQLIFFSEEKELEFGLSAYREGLRQERLSENSETNDMVQRVGQRIARASNKPEYQWEFAVIDDDKTVNTFALPAGKWWCLPGCLR